MIRALEKYVLIHTEHEMRDVNDLLLILLTILNFCWNYLIFKLFFFNCERYIYIYIYIYILEDNEYQGYYKTTQERRSPEKDNKSTALQQPDTNHHKPNPTDQTL